MGLGDGPAEPGISLGVARQDHQVGAGRIRRAGAGGAGQGELGPEHRRQAEHHGGPSEADHAVQAVVVGQGQGLEAEASGGIHQLLGVRRPVQEAEVGVAVQLGIRGWRRHQSYVPSTHQRPCSRASKWAPEAVTTCMRARRRRPGTDHHRSSAGHGPAHPSTSTHAPPSTESRTGRALAVPPAVTPTG